MSRTTITPRPTLYKNNDFIFRGNVGQDLTNCNLRAVLCDNYGNIVKKCSVDVQGGSESQIDFNGLSGIYEVYFTEDEVRNFKGDVQLLVQMENLSNQKTVIYDQYIEVLESPFGWDVIDPFITVQDITLRSDNFDINISIHAPIL